MLVKQINNGVYKVLDDDSLRKIYTCLEELQLWKGENPFDVDAGVDYFGIFDNRIFIETELSRVLDKHKDAYNSYQIENLTYEDGVLGISIILDINSELTYRFNLHINAPGG